MTQVDERSSADLAALLEEARARLQANHQTEPGVDVVRRYSEDIDALVARHCEALAATNPAFERAHERFAIVATGGYGRRELNLFSDIDLLFLFRSEPQETDARFIKAFLYPMWNLKVELGYSVKTMRQVLEEAGHDVDLTTSLIGTHAIWGDAAIANELNAKLRLEISLRHHEELTRAILDSMAARHRKYQNTRLLLEPNIKDSPGGLRDIHVLRWISFIHFGDDDLGRLTSEGLATVAEERRLRFAHAFLLGLRNAVHLLDGRKNDQLTVERQIRIAAEWGIQSREHLLPEEQLMRSYYEHAGVVDRLAQRILKKFKEGPRPAKGAGKKTLRASRIEGHFWTRENQIWVDPRQVANLARDPSWMMQLFSLAGLHGLQPDDFTLNFVENRSADVTDKVRRSLLNRDRFLGILKNPKYSAQTLRAMHRCRFLEAYVPEFSLVRNLPRIDYYHQFTVDEHLLRSVECAAELFDERNDFGRSHVARVAREILRWDLLVFALLMHDVGKGEGRGHVIRGAHLIQRVSERMNLQRKEADVLHHLVLNHQKMSTLALKRNPDDPRIPGELAKDAGDPEMLRMLYVLTCCDLRAVSHQSWNDWRASLLATLYERTMDVLMGRTDRHRRAPISHEVMTLKVLEELERLGGIEPPEHGPDDLQRDVARLFEDLPERYRHSTPPATAARHIRLARQLHDKNPVAWELEPVEGGNYAYLHCVAYDMPGLFGNLCGAFASRGYNILSAQVYTATNGTCIDVFQIQDAEGQPPSDPGVLERLRQKLIKVLRGEKPPDWLDQVPHKEPVISSARLDQRPPEVTISNEQADTHTLIEVQAPDRPGLLFDITRLLDRHRLNIDLAIVATGSYSVVDVFYVTDWENNRLEPGTKTEKLRQELLEAVSPRATVSPPEEPAGQAPPDARTAER